MGEIDANGILKVTGEDTGKGTKKFIYSTLSTIQDDNVKTKLGDKVNDVEEALREAGEWLEDNEDAQAEDITAKRKEVEKIVHPIMGSMYGGKGGGDDEDFDAEEEEEL